MRSLIDILDEAIRLGASSNFFPFPLTNQISCNAYAAASPAKKPMLAAASNALAVSGANMVQKSIT